MKNLTFVTGAARSGKSLLAEELASASKKPVYYLASMRIYEADPEQVRRLKIHRDRRPANWQTIDAAFNAHEVVSSLPVGKAVVIFDCLSLYLTNLLLGTAGGDNPSCASEACNNDPYEMEEGIMEQLRLLIESMEARDDLEFIVVSNEVGWGLVPETKIGRAFRDYLGLSNQLFAREADRVFLTCSGLKLQLK